VHPADFLFPESVAYASGNLQEGTITPRCTTEDSRQVPAFLMITYQSSWRTAAMRHICWHAGYREHNRKSGLRLGVVGHESQAHCFQRRYLL
jgi:hypothetical protein